MSEPVAPQKSWSLQEKQQVANRIYHELLFAMAKYEGPASSAHHYAQKIAQKAVNEMETWVLRQIRGTP